jgi:hypothetical protein
MKRLEVAVIVAVTLRTVTVPVPLIGGIQSNLLLPIPLFRVATAKAWVMRGYNLRKSVENTVVSRMSQKDLEDTVLPHPELSKKCAYARL